eukprot:5451003-Prymnesium_polylepis.1
MLCTCAGWLAMQACEQRSTSSRSAVPHLVAHGGTVDGLLAAARRTAVEARHGPSAARRAHTSPPPPTHRQRAADARHRDSCG